MPEKIKSFQCPDCKKKSLFLHMQIINYRTGELDLKNGEFEESAESEDANFIKRELRCQKCWHKLTMEEEEKLNI